MVAGRVRVPGLGQAVRVRRDRYGVAHLYAQNQHDLFFAQGFVAAQDRLFQMELWKRAGQGRLSEVLGAGAVTRDVRARQLMYRGDMDAEYASYDVDARAILTAFTDGINAYIASLTNGGSPGLPIEFKIAGFAPEAWRPEDCLNRLAAYSMTGNARSELVYARALRELGPSKTARIVEFDPPVALDPDPSLDLSGLAPELLESFIGSDHRIAFPPRPIEGSNNWTVAGARTRTGAPLLANDPHRVVGLPSLRYMVHLVAPGWNVIGAGEPGLPGVALGHNEQIAWGFTIFGLDQQDLYVEELNAGNALEYRTRQGWKTMQVREETIAVRGAPSQQVQLRFTQHGPVIWQDGRRALVLRWVGSEPGTAGYLASLAIDRAHNWQQFEAAVPRWKVPSENLVYADRAGNIGEHSAGLAPVRHWTGLLPVPGTGGYEWNGFVPADQLPHSFNPPAGYIATANHKMIPGHYPYKVGFEWEAPYRISRIRDVFTAAARDKRTLSVEDMQALQGDVTSLAAQGFQRLIGTTSLRGESAVRDLLAWDGRLTRESSAAALYEVWLRHITEALGAQLSAPFAAHYSDLGPDTVLRLFATPQAEIFGARPRARRDEILAQTLQAALRELERLMGPDRSRWQWGTLHTLFFRHALDAVTPATRTLFDLGPFSRPGDEYTVNATGMPSDSWEQVTGASYRQIIDVGDWDRSVAVNTPGQSGQPTSVHYSDLEPRWDAGQYFPLSYSEAAVQAASTDELTLEP